MTRSSLDAHQQKQVLDFEMALHQKEAKATEAIREAKAHCRATIREAEANCASIVTEVEAHCTADIRKAESCCVEYAHSSQQLHAAGMQHLEMEATEEERRDSLSFLTACGMALQACPPEACGGTNGSPPFTQGEHVLGYCSEDSTSDVFH